MGSIGVTGSPAANALAREADLVLAVGTRLQDFTTGSNALFPKANVVGINVNALDAVKLRGVSLIADAGRGLRRAVGRGQSLARGRSLDRAGEAARRAVAHAHRSADFAQGRRARRQAAL